MTSLTLLRTQFFLGLIAACGAVCEADGVGSIGFGRKKRSGYRLSLIQQLDYYGKLSSQITWRGKKVSARSESSTTSQVLRQLQYCKMIRR